MLQRLLIGVMVILALGGCASGGSAPGGAAAVPATPVEPAEVQQYRIGAGDQIAVNVWQHPDLSGGLVVLPDGEISLPLVGELKADGLTEKELADTIRTRLSEYVRNPEVTVTVTNPANFQQRVRVTGAVLRPASLPHRKGMTVLDLVLEAGGPNEFASANATKLYRSAGGSAQVLKVYLDDILKKGDMATNYELQPSDVLTVPERLF
ncbi:MAG: hypothetical protein CALGDGBN_00669 [Pseudomonadales bacterium]|nr:hypothetical protein [Pseudomonadales bacterium]